jgi:hypothetical protein
MSAFVSTRSSDSAVTAAVGDQVAFDFDEKLRVRQAYPIADSGTEHLDVLLAGKLERHAMLVEGLESRY